MFHTVEYGSYIRWLGGYLKETKYKGIVIKIYSDQQINTKINTNVSGYWNTDILR